MTGQRDMDGDTIHGEAMVAAVCTIVIAAVLKNTGGQSFGESFAAGGGGYGVSTITDVILAGDSTYPSRKAPSWRGWQMWRGKGLRSWEKLAEGIPINR